MIETTNQHLNGRFETGLGSQPQVLFLHALNTFGDDLLHIGPIKLGRMDRELKPAFAEHGIKILSVDGVGQGSPEEQANFVFDWMKVKFNEGELQADRPLAILGNSLGGLVARVVAHKLPFSEFKNCRIPMILTWGTPHRGTIAAGLGSSFEKRFQRTSKLVHKASSILGADVERREQTYRHYTPAALSLFNLNYPRLTNGTREISLICRVPIQEVSPCFLPFYPMLHGRGIVSTAAGYLSQNETFAPSDGFVPVGSQSWGETVGDFRLDHFVQMGFVELLPRAQQRKFARSEFQNLVATMAKLLHS